MTTLGEYIKQIYGRLENLDKKLEKVISKTILPDFDNQDFKSHSRTKYSDEEHQNQKSTNNSELLKEIVDSFQPNIEKDPQKRKEIQETIEKKTDILRQQIIKAQNSTKITDEEQDSNTDEANPK